MFRVSRFAKVLTVVAVLATAVAFAAGAKKYQVTGKVLEASDTIIVVEKGNGERWEVGRDKDTKVDGDLKVGAKATIHYRMIANDVEVKGEKSAK